MVLANQKPGFHEDFILLKVDNEFNVMAGWPKSYGGEGDEKDGSLIQTQDGGFAIFGTSVNSKDVYSMVLIKMNRNGELIN